MIYSDNDDTQEFYLGGLDGSSEIRDSDQEIANSPPQPDHDSSPKPLTMSRDSSPTNSIKSKHHDLSCVKKRRKKPRNIYVTPQKQRLLRLKQKEREENKKKVLPDDVEYSSASLESINNAFEEDFGRMLRGEAVEDTQTPANPLEVAVDLLLGTALGGVALEKAITEEANIDEIDIGTGGEEGFAVDTQSVEGERCADDDDPIHVEREGSVSGYGPLHVEMGGVADDGPLHVEREGSVADDPSPVEMEGSVTDEPLRIERERSASDDPLHVEREKSVPDAPPHVEMEGSVADETLRMEKEKSIADDPPLMERERSVIDDPLRTEREESVADDNLRADGGLSPVLTSLLSAKESSLDAPIGSGEKFNGGSPSCQLLAEAEKNSENHDHASEEEVSGIDSGPEVQRIIPQVKESVVRVPGRDLFQQISVEETQRPRRSASILSAASAGSQSRPKSPEPGLLRLEALEGQDVYMGRPLERHLPFGPDYELQEHIARGLDSVPNHKEDGDEDMVMVDFR